MLVPRSYQPLAREQSTFMGVTVMGGVVNQFAQALVQMSHCKFLGHANYTIAKDTIGRFATIFNVVTNTNWSGISPGLNKTNKYYSFYYGSTPISEWIGVIFQYVATNSSSGNSPAITFRIKMEILTDLHWQPQVQPFMIHQVEQVVLMIQGPCIFHLQTVVICYCLKWKLKTVTLFQFLSLIYINLR